MAQNSVAHAVARVHVLGRDALDEGRIDRLLSASNYEEALRALTEIGWTNDTVKDPEQAAAEHVRAACELVRQIAPEEAAIDCFLLRYDAINLKMLLKARCCGQKPEALSRCGTIPVEVLERCVTDHTYAHLPETLKNALDGLEKALAVREDPLEIDVTVDKAVCELTKERLKAVKSPVIRGYFSARSDMLNAIMLLRVRKMGRDAAFMTQMLLPGGTIGETEWLKAFERPELIGRMLEKYGTHVKNAAQDAALEPSKMPALEKAADDALLAPFSKLRYDALRPEPICGYLLGAEREAAAVRLILAGKLNGFKAEAIRERLRELYGK